MAMLMLMTVHTTLRMFGWHSIPVKLDNQSATLWRHVSGLTVVQPTQ